MDRRNLGGYRFGLISSDFTGADLEHRLSSYVIDSRRQPAIWRTVQLPLTMNNLMAFGCKGCSIVGDLQQAPGLSTIGLENCADALAEQSDPAPERSVRPLRKRRRCWLRQQDFETAVDLVLKEGPLSCHMANGTKLRISYHEPERQLRDRGRAYFQHSTKTVNSLAFAPTAAVLNS